MTDSFATVIGPGVFIKGSIQSRQDVIVHGQVEGDLDVEDFRLTIGPGGKASGNAKAREVDIHGSLDGDVNSATRISIRTGGRLFGDIRTAGILIEDEAEFKGGVVIVNTSAHQRPAGEVQ